LAPPPAWFDHWSANVPSALGVGTMLLRNWHMAVSLLLCVRVVNELAFSCL
jgi:hypothetical protein